MPKILFPENAWTLGTLQGVNVVSNRVAPSKEIKVTVTNNSDNDMSGGNIIIPGNPYMFDLLYSPQGHFEPSFVNGDPTKYQLMNWTLSGKKWLSMVKLENPDESPVTFGPGDSVQFTVVPNRATVQAALGWPTTYNNPFQYSLGTKTLQDKYFKRPMTYWGDTRGDYCIDGVLLLYGDFIDVYEMHGDVNPYNPGYCFLSCYEYHYTGWLGRCFIRPGRELGVFTRSGTTKPLQSSLSTLPSPGNRLYRFVVGSSYAASGYYNEEGSYVGLATIGSEEVRSANINDYFFTPGTRYLTGGPSGINDPLNTSTLLPFLRGDYSWDWSFSFPEELYWLSPIIQLPYELNLATINWSEIGGFGRIDVDEFDPQDYEIRYSVEPPEGDAAGTIPDTDGNQLNYWTPNNSWTEAGSWQIKEKNTGGGPMKFVQIRIRFQG